MTWPTSRPGYPRDAERDGWHWLQVSDWPPHAEEWSAARREWKGYHGNKAFDVREGMRALIRYLGPCYAQADLDAAVQAAARVGDIAVNQTAEMRDQLREIDEAVVALSKIVIGEGVLPAGNYPGAAPMLNHLHDTIRARGPTPALDAALAQARREGARDAREQIAKVFEDNDMLSTASEIRALPISAAAGEGAPRGE